jgi:hypothetical protein
MNYAAKFSGHGGKKVVKYQTDFIVNKKNPGRIGFYYIFEKRKEFFS